MIDMTSTDSWTLAVIIAMACLTVLARCFFFISSRAWSLPAWLQRGLNYAPIAALSAVVAPEVLLTQGQWMASALDARLIASAAGLAAFYWQRDVVATITVGMAVYLPLHLGLGW